MDMSNVKTIKPEFVSCKFKFELLRAYNCLLKILNDLDVCSLLQGMGGIKTAVIIK